MQTRIEPPILLSRLLALVFVATLVVLSALAITLYKMFPLDRPEVFFLQSAYTTDTEITLTEANPSGDGLNDYGREFVKEYVKARNEIRPNLYVMGRIWDMVKTMSTDDIYADFANTAMYQRFLMDSAGGNGSNWDVSCSIEFPSNGVHSFRHDKTSYTYTVDIMRFCTNSYGQTDRKDYTMNYTIKVKLIADDAQGTKWIDHMKNPLGLRVAEYLVESGNGDPLDTVVIGNK